MSSRYDDPIIRFDFDRPSVRSKGDGWEDRPAHIPISLIVLHSTEHLPYQTFAGVCSYLRDSPRASTHYVIDLDGTIQRIVDPQYRAWQAGISMWQGQQNVNDFSIGIELYHRQGGEPYTEAQWWACRWLCRDLMIDRPALHRRNVALHRWIAPGRKIDPTDRSDDWFHAWINKI